MDTDDQLQAARDLRRAMLGDDDVDAQTAEADPALRDFPDHITAQAWGVWTRGGARSRTGLTDDELNELLLQVAAYCGAPAGIAAERALVEVRAAERDA